MQSILCKNIYNRKYFMQKTFFFYYVDFEKKEERTFKKFKFAKGTGIILKVTEI